MSFHTILFWCGWVAVLLGLIGTLAQFSRATKLGIEGISLATWVLFCFMGCFWMTYGAVSAHSWTVILGSLVVFPFQVAIVFRLKPWRHWAVSAQSLAFFVACCVTPTLLWGWAGGVYGTGIAMTVNRTPQILELIKTTDASGVSVGSWVMGVLGSGLWILYYVGQRLWAPLVATMVAGIANLVIALLASWRHAQVRDIQIADVVFAD